VLHLDGASLRPLPYVRRRDLLAELVNDGPVLIAPRHVVKEREALLAATADQGLEGVVAKRLDAPYAEGRRSRSWIKIKHRRRERLVVTGWRDRDGELPEFLVARRGRVAGCDRPARRRSGWTVRSERNCLTNSQLAVACVGCGLVSS
jgi:ATP-dependent DNA ligase